MRLRCQLRPDTWNGYVLSLSAKLPTKPSFNVKKHVDSCIIDVQNSNRSKVLSYSNLKLKGLEPQRLCHFLHFGSVTQLNHAKHYVAARFAQGFFRGMQMGRKKSKNEVVLILASFAQAKMIHPCHRARWPQNKPDAGLFEIENLSSEHLFGARNCKIQKEKLLHSTQETMPSTHSSATSSSESAHVCGRGNQSIHLLSLSKCHYGLIYMFPFSVRGVTQATALHGIRSFFEKWYFWQTVKADVTCFTRYSSHRGSPWWLRSRVVTSEFPHAKDATTFEVYAHQIQRRVEENQILYFV